MEARKLVYIGSGMYRGWDNATGQPLRASHGATVVVASTCARRLLTDFPSRWEDRGPAELTATESSHQATKTANIIRLPKQQGRRRS